MKVILLFCLYSSIFASSIDWTRLEMEMSYLESSQTSDQKTTDESSEVALSPAGDEDTPKLARKSILDDKEIPQLDTVFDSINTKLASPEKEDFQNIDKPRKRPATGTISKDEFESLIE